MAIDTTPGSSSPGDTPSAGLYARAAPGTGWLRSRSLRTFLRHPQGVVGAVVFSAILLVAGAAPLLAPLPPEAVDAYSMFKPPSAAHWLGTDQVGRDIWSRTVYGARVSLFVGLMAVLLRTSIGLILGAVSGYFGGIVDMGVQRIVDVMMAFPTLFFLLILVSLLGPSMVNVFIAIGLLSWPSDCRLFRSRVLSIRAMDYILAARSVGVGNGRIILRHVTPNLLGFALVSMTYGIGGAILAEAGISFLGLGVPPPTPSWGNLIQAANNMSVLQLWWWMWVVPGVALITCVLALNLIGDGLRDVFDPHRIR